MQITNSHFAFYFGKLSFRIKAVSPYLTDCLFATIFVFITFVPAKQKLKQQLMHEKGTYVRIEVADPTPLGLTGLAMVTLVAASQKLGLTEGLSLLIPWAIFLGGFAQLIACVYDFKHNNLFGATAFGLYGLFWISVAASWMIKMGVFGPILAGAFDVRQLGVIFLGYLIISIFITIAAFKTNKALIAIMVLIDVLFIGLMMDSFGMGTYWHTIAAWTELSISLIGFYAAGANLLNKMYGRVILPLGKGIWE